VHFLHTLYAHSSYFSKLENRCKCKLSLVLKTGYQCSVYLEIAGDAEEMSNCMEAG
jgi:hypothetical protein